MLEAKDTGASVLQKKKASNKIFWQSPKKKEIKRSLKKNFTGDLENFHSKNSAVLEPRTVQFQRTRDFKAKDFKMCPRGHGRP